jgi:CHAD domain-containing protein
MAASNRTICQFGAKRLLPVIKAFSRQIQGVREGSDTEYVHRMRVASRRLRSALPLFSSCFPEKKYKRWVKGIRAITRSLGAARDTDVQITFLASYIEEHPSGTNDGTGIASLTTMLLERRKRQQADVLAALGSLKDSRAVGEFSVSFRGMRDKLSVKKDGGDTAPELYRMAAGQIHVILDELQSLDPNVHNPLDSAGHHRARIVVKKLRYTLEIYRVLYPDQLKPVIRQLKKLQQLLGELHDCDAWIQVLTTDIHEGGIRPEGADEAGGSVLPSSPDLSGLLLNRRGERERIYGELVSFWQECHTSDLWGGLKAEIDTEAETSRPQETTTNNSHPAEKTLEPVHALMGSFPEGEGHAEQVTRLALMLFDELTSLHGYSAGERFLLECAGLLHDIGWEFGQKGHHTQSYRMILADRTLPLNVREKRIVSLVACYHRKAVPGMQHNAYAILSGKDRQIVSTLAAMLRVADGLDYTHMNRISGLACSITDDEVVCSTESSGDSHVEKVRALQKADLFEQVFRRRLSIP